jgi:hypothetical protein
MAIIDQITVGDVLHVVVDADPTISGASAPVGSIASWNNSGAGFVYLKTGSTTTSWTRIDTGAIDLTNNVVNALPIANGGTGQSSFTNGQLLIGNTTGNTLAKATLTAGTGISITNGNGTITIANTGEFSTGQKIINRLCYFDVKVASADKGVSLTSATYTSLGNFTFDSADYTLGSSTLTIELEIVWTPGSNPSAGHIRLWNLTTNTVVANSTLAISASSTSIRANSIAVALSNFASGSNIIEMQANWSSGGSINVDSMCFKTINTF